MIELPAHVEDRIFQFFMKYSIPRLLEMEEEKEKGEMLDEKRKGA